MRLRFLPTGAAWDDAARAEVLARIDAWWSAFGARHDDLRALFAQEQSWDVAAWMAEHLQAVDERLCWEFGPGLAGGHRLVITPESHRELGPLVDTLLARCPGYDGWSFHHGRLREGAAAAAAMIAARGLPALDKVLVACAPTDACLVDLTFHLKRFGGPDLEDARHTAWIASEILLGEETLNTWLGDVEVRKGGGKRAGGVPLAELAARFDEAVADVQAQLPGEPLWKSTEGLTGALWKLEPPEQEEYPEQRDLLVGKSFHQRMWEAAHGGTVFDSRRYSRFDELFVYVKLDGREGLDEERFEDKAAIEDALDAALKPRALGAVVGGGTGLHYSYVDLALTRHDEGIQAAIDVLREGRVGPRSWIQFFDARLANEWVGVWDESPPPPGFA